MADDIGIRYRVDDSELISSMRKYEDGMDKMQANGQKLERNQKKNFDRIGQAIDRNDKKVKQNTKSLSTFGDTFKAVFTAEAALRGLDTVIRKMGDLRQKAIDNAAEYEQLQVSFEVFLGSASAARKILDDLNKFSRATPYEPEQVTKAGKALLAFGIEQEKLIPTLKVIGDTAAATGKDFNELAVIYGKARTQGVLFAEDINQLTEAGIPIIAELANQFNVAESQVKKLGSEGKITFSDLEEAFRNMTGEGGRFEDLMDKQSETFRGLQSTASGAFNEMLRHLGNRMLPALKQMLGIVTNVSNGLARMFGAGESDAKKQIKALRESNAAANLLFGTIRQLSVRLGELKEGTEEYNATAKAKEVAIDKINEEYKDYLPNLLSEKSSLVDIEKAQKAVNEQLTKRGLILAYQDKFAELAAERAEAQLKLQEYTSQIAETRGSESFNDPRYVDAYKAKLAELLPVQQKQIDLIEETDKKREKVFSAMLADAEAMNLSIDEILNPGGEEASNIVNTFDKIGESTGSATDETNKYKDALEALQAQVQEFRNNALSDPERLREEWKLAVQELENLKTVLQAFSIAQGIEFDPSKIDAYIEKVNSNFRAELMDFELEPLGEEGDEFLDKFFPDGIPKIKINAEPDEEGLKGFANDFEKAIGESLGMDSGAFEEFKYALSDVFSNISNMLAENTQAQLDANQTILDSLRERINETESLLDEEQQKKEKGYANNVDAKKRELERLEAEEKEHEEKRQKLKQKALKQQLLQESLAQAANLATAITKIFNANAGIPVVGIALAAAAVTGLIATFSKFKNAAKDVTTQPLFKGGKVNQLLRGKTDRFGGEGHRVENSNVVLGGEEFVMNGKSTRKNISFLEKMNSGEYDQVDLQKVLNFGQLFNKKFKPVSPISAELGSIAQKMNEEIGREKRSNQSNMDAAIERANDRLLRGLTKYFDERPQYIPKSAEGYIEKRKGYTGHVDFK